MTEATGTADARGTDRILTVPNALSLLRLIGVPVFLWLVLVTHADVWALILLAASSFTDWADGKLARLLDQTSRLGALLDPAVEPGEQLRKGSGGGFTEGLGQGPFHPPEPDRPA